MTNWHGTIARGAWLAAAVVAILLLGLFQSVVADAVERGPTRLVDATATQSSASNHRD